MITAKYKRNIIKSTILIGLLDIISLELCRYILQIPPSFLYYLIIMALFILTLNFLFFIDYILKKIQTLKKLKKKKSDALSVKEYLKTSTHLIAIHVKILDLEFLIISKKLGKNTESKVLYHLKKRVLF